MLTADYVRPTTFERGAVYFLKERNKDRDELVLSPVKFVSYDPCPAMVIIENDTGRRRYPREDLFICTLKT